MSTPTQAEKDLIVDEFVDQILPNWEQQDCVSFIQELIANGTIPFEIIERQVK